MLWVSLFPVHEHSISSKISGISLVNILQFSAPKACTLFISKYLVVFIRLQMASFGFLSVSPVHC